MGRLDAAITEYARVVEDQPRDWTTANTLGDLYVRASQLDRAVALYDRIAVQLLKEGFYPRAAALYRKILKVAPNDDLAQIRLAEISVRQGLLADAKAGYTAVANRRRQRGDTAGVDDITIRLGAVDPADLPARLAGAQALERTGAMPAAARTYRTLYDELIEQGRENEAASVLEDCVRSVDAAADAAVDAGDFGAAAALLQDFAARVPGRISTLLRLVEVSVDGGLDSVMYAAQAQLADAYLAAQRPDEARMIAEDLVTREPGDVAHVSRLRRALQALPVDDVEAVIAARLAAAEPTGPLEATTPAPPVIAVAPPPAPPVQTPPTKPAPTAGHATAEIDLTAMLGQLETDPGELSPRAVEASTPDMEEIFAGLRANTGADGEFEESDEYLALGRTYIEMDMPEEAVTWLKIAARSPRHRFEAASALGRICRDQSDLAGAIEWFERAAETPSRNPAESHALLYDLGDVLEAIGERSRALAIFLELAADAPDFRDVDGRVTLLSSAETEG